MIEDAASVDIEPFEFFGDEGDVVLWHGRMFHSATPNYSNPPQIRQMILYDAYKKSVYDRAYNGRYVKGPRPSPPPNVRKLRELELGPEVPPPEGRGSGMTGAKRFALLQSLRSRHEHG